VENGFACSKLKHGQCLWTCGKRIFELNKNILKVSHASIRREYLPRKFAAVECAYPDAAAAAAKCPKLNGCLKNPVAAAVAAVTLLRPEAAATAESSDDLDGASILSMVNSDEPTADVFGTAAEPAAVQVAIACLRTSESQSHCSRGGGGDDDDDSPCSSTAVVDTAEVGGRSGRSPLSPRPADDP